MLYLHTFWWMVCVMAELTILAVTQDDAWRQDQINHQPTYYNNSQMLRICRMTDINRLHSHLDHVLIPRAVDTENHKLVSMYIEQTLQSLGYIIELDRFTAGTSSGTKTFTNIIATLGPIGNRRLTLACHYDSKDMKSKYGFDFMGATDSAFPCSMLLDMAQALAPYISNREATDVTLQFIFFDGEEAFGEWTARDSLYGSRHLANVWQRRPYGASTHEMDRVDLLIVLDLLGAAGSSIPNYLSINDQKAYTLFADSELLLRYIPSCLDTSGGNGHTIFKGRVSFVVEDDQQPFFRKGIPVLHMVPRPFPRVWHSRLDDRSALNDVAMSNLATLLRVFVARYLAIRL